MLGCQGQGVSSRSEAGANVALTYRSNARDATLSGTVFDAGVNIIEGLTAFAQLTANAGHTRFR